jgi:hypothetical protein
MMMDNRITVYYGMWGINYFQSFVLLGVGKLETRFPLPLPETKRFHTSFISCRWSIGGGERSKPKTMNHNNNNSQQTPTSLSPEASRLFRVYRTISSMLDKRGYMVPRDLREMTPSSFISKFGDQPSREGLTILVVRVFYRSF